MNGQKKTEQAAQFLISSLRNYLLHMLILTKSPKKIIARHDLETEGKTFDAKDLKVKRI